MRLSLIPILLAAAASALPTRMDSSVERRGVLLPAAPAPRDEHSALAAEHAQARRAGRGIAHGSGLRKVRRMKTKRARKCRPRTSSSTSTPAPTGGDWGQTWTKPDHNSSSDKGSSSNWWDRPNVDGGSSDWSSSATTSTEHGKPSPSSDEESPSPSPSPSPSASPSPSDDEESSSSSSSWGGEGSSSSSSSWGGESNSPSPSPSASSRPSNDWGGESQSASASGSEGGSASPTGNPEAPKPSAGGQGGGNLEHMLFPKGRGTAFWTTSTGGLSFEEALLPLQYGQLPNVGKAPDGSVAFEQVYPAGKHGEGYSFYCGGQKNGVNVEGAREVTFAYSIFFADGFQWTKGGKLPGIYGGTSIDAAKSCSGGRSDGRGDCFSARLMWRANGDGELYNYFPPDAQNDYCNLPPKSVCNKNFGDSIGRGAFQFKAGQWNTVSQRLKLNDPGQKNGEQELFINGQSVISLNNIMVTMDPNAKLYGIMAQTFFGGGSSDFAPPSDQTAWFKDWSLAMS